MKLFRCRIVLILILTIAVLESSSVFAARPLQSTTANQLYVDFTGSSLPTGWSLQGNAKFIGGLNASSGVGGVQIVRGENQEGAIVYGNRVTSQNLVVELRGAYGELAKPVCNEADDIGVGFYSSGPLGSNGRWNPSTANGYYAAYEFYSGSSPALTYRSSSTILSQGAKGNLPSCGLNFLYAATTITPTSVSMDQTTNNRSAFIQTPTNLKHVLTYSNSSGIDNSHGTLYIGGATGTLWTNEYVYWLRLSGYSIENMTESSSSLFSSVTSSLTSTSPVQTQTYAAIIAVILLVIVVIAGFAFKRRRQKTELNTKGPVLTT